MSQISLIQVTKYGRFLLLGQTESYSNSRKTQDPYLQGVRCSGKQPTQGGSWGQRGCLDILSSCVVTEWLHT